ncbi:MAG: DinB family protein [Acidobacteriaceae bacterium]|nr:DinB family protein [Acidobacteriaceae bacterium]MBV9499292.1 DinB family protein [Acidobacteriaceae bacterium]
MKNFVGLAALLLLGGTAAIDAQTTALVNEVKQTYQSLKNNLTKSAEKIPEEDYSFKPTPEIRSASEVLEHVVMAQAHTCAAIAGDQSTMTSVKADSKASVIAGLKAAFAECDKAYDGLTDANAMEMVKTGRGERTRVGALIGNSNHDIEQYAILSVYMRLKGIVPPSSERSAGK